MKTILTVCACLFALATFSRAETGTVKVDKLNIRAQAKGNAETVVQLTKGDRVTILDKKTAAGDKDKKSTTWLKIALPDKATVWIKSEFVKDGVVTAEKVNVRSGAGVNFSIVGLVHRGDKVQPVRTLADWSEIRPTASCFGWVSSEYIDIAPELQGAPPAETIQPATPSTSVTPVPTTSGVQVISDHPIASGQPVIVAPSEPAATASANPTATVIGESAGPSTPVTREGVLHSCANYLLKRPGTHALWQEGVGKPYIIAYLNSATVSLDQYEGRRVQVIGQETTLINWKSPVIEVQKAQTTWQ
ncbi:MAG: hypothetical protein EXS18_08185 [Verrucomicrobiae bacterium]|nr:hypothetical protein [Verrucomicrobiae bacterium]